MLVQSSLWAYRSMILKWCDLAFFGVENHTRYTLVKFRTTDSLYYDSIYLPRLLARLTANCCVLDVQEDCQGVCSVFGNINLKGCLNMDSRLSLLH